MKFTSLQTIVFDLLDGSASFGGKTVYDFGFQKADVEDFLDVGNGGPGYFAGVWPVTRAMTTSDDASGVAPVLATVVVRLEISPKLLQLIDAAYQADNTKPRVDEYLNGLIQDLIDAVLADAPDAGGVKFEMARDAFEMVNFDEGLIAFHIRFQRFCVI